MKYLEAVKHIVKMIKRRKSWRYHRNCTKNLLTLIVVCYEWLYMLTCTHFCFMYKGIKC